MHLLKGQLPIAAAQRMAPSIPGTTDPARAIFHLFDQDKHTAARDGCSGGDVPQLSTLGLSAAPAFAASAAHLLQSAL